MPRSPPSQTEEFCVTATPCEPLPSIRLADTTAWDAPSTWTPGPALSLIVFAPIRAPEERETYIPPDAPLFRMRLPWALVGITTPTRAYEPSITVIPALELN